MALSDRLAELADAGSTRAQVTGTPAGWEPGIKYEPSGEHLITLPPSVALDTEDSWEAAVSSLGLRLPDGMRLELVEAKYDPMAWTRSEEFTVHPETGRRIRTPATTAPVWRYRFRCVPDTKRIGVDELVKAIGKRKAKTAPVNSELPAFLVATADTQIGDGETAEVVERFQEMTAAAVDRYKTLRKAGRCSGEVYLPWLGDCIQGTVTSAPILKNDLTIVEMLRVFRRLALWQVQQFMDIAKVTMVAIPGNHDQPKRDGKGPAYDADQSWAVEGILSVADALRLAGRDDVDFVYPAKDRSTVTLDIAGTVVAMAHGHQWSGPASKIHGWWAGQSHGRTSPGAADVLLTGHRHHFYAEVAGGNRLAVVCPPVVSSSGYWTEAVGDDTAPGMVTMLIGQGRWSGLEVV